MNASALDELARLWLALPDIADEDEADDIFEQVYDLEPMEMLALTEKVLRQAVTTRDCERAGLLLEGLLYDENVSHLVRLADYPTFGGAWASMRAELAEAPLLFEAMKGIGYPPPGA